MKTKLFKWANFHKTGVFVLLLLIVLLQIIYLNIDVTPSSAFSEISYTSFKNKIQTLENRQKNKIYPFNPNFISAEKAERLGLAKQAFERLTKFRESGRFVNSKEDFQKVTQVSDTFLNRISPFFKFPKWVIERELHKKEKLFVEKVQKMATKKDINAATLEELSQVYGIGEKLSERIIKYREHLQGFSDKGQMSEVYGLSSEVIERIWQKFDLKTLPNIQKIDINLASKYELSKIPYLNFKEAEAIIEYRSRVGVIQKVDELIQINELSVEKIKKIKVYLSAENEK